VITVPAITTTITGNTTGDPELRFTPAGVPVATFTVAVNERYKAASGEWTDGPTSFVRCIAWRDLGEHVAESVAKGDRVMVAGAFREREYEVQSQHAGDSGKRRVWELNATEVGASLRYATAKIAKVRRDGVPLPEDPWADQAPPPSAPSASDEPPF
jgi:single-strand DNA-binding protein